MSNVSKIYKPERINRGPVTQILSQRAIRQPDPADMRYYIEIIADKLLEKAAAGDVQSISLAFAYIQGKPAQTVTVEQALSVLDQANDEELALASNVPVRELRARRDAHEKTEALQQTNDPEKKALLDVIESLRAELDALRGNKDE